MATNEPLKVYVLEAGEDYNEYIVGVFLTADKAKSVWQPKPRDSDDTVRDFYYEWVEDSDGCWSFDASGSDDAAITEYVLDEIDLIEDRWEDFNMKLKNSG